ncbi:Actin-85C, partial [Taenia solium]
SYPGSRTTRVASNVCYDVPHAVSSVEGCEFPQDIGHLDVACRDLTCHLVELTVEIEYTDIHLTAYASTMKCDVNILQHASVLLSDYTVFQGSAKRMQREFMLLAGAK